MIETGFCEGLGVLRERESDARIEHCTTRAPYNVRCTIVLWKQLVSEIVTGEQICLEHVFER